MNVRWYGLLASRERQAWGLYEPWTLSSWVDLNGGTVWPCGQLKAGVVIILSTVWAWGRYDIHPTPHWKAQDLSNTCWVYFLLGGQVWKVYEKIECFFLHCHKVWLSPFNFHSFRYILLLFALVLSFETWKLELWKPSIQVQILTICDFRLKRQADFGQVSLVCSEHGKHGIMG